MLDREIVEILNRSLVHGWVMEPEAKRLFSLAGLPVPRFSWARDLDQALADAAVIGYPVAAKVVSPAIIHKSEVGGVAAGIRDAAELAAFYRRVATVADFAGILVEEMANGHELIVGAAIDHQFGPVVLLGIGGTAVEVYGDVAIRMAPLAADDVLSMLSELKGGRLLTGYRGGTPVDRDKLVACVLAFSSLMGEIAPYIESVDVNPLFCSAKGCVVADARIMLNRRLQPGAATGSVEN